MSVAGNFQSPIFGQLDYKLEALLQYGTPDINFPVDTR